MRVSPGLGCPRTSVFTQSISQCNTANANKFPYALAALPSTLAAQWDTPPLLPYTSAFPPAHRASPTALTTHVHDLTARDVKEPALKALQGYLWTQGYHSGALRCPLFPDVAPALARWSSPNPSRDHPQPLTIAIYSSGSIPAQKLLVQHTTAGDLSPRVRGYFDTVSAGPKTAAASYAHVAAAMGVEVGAWLFLSDNPAEVRAAREAGMRAQVVVREGNVVLGEGEAEELGAVGGFGVEEVGV